MMQAAVGAALAVHKVFLALPTKGRRSAIQLLPEEARPVGVALQFISSAQVKTLASQLPQLQTAVYDCD